MTDRLRILFVDDEKAILQGLRRMLRPMRNHWDMIFVDSGAQALAVLAHDGVDVLISDMRMPGMDGEQLLKVVSEKYPQVIRVVLTGQADQQGILGTIKSSHQYFTKPFNADALKQFLRRLLELRDLLENQQIKKLIGGMKTLPSMPGVFSELIQILEKETVDTKEIARIIGQDIGMTAQILKLVSSAYFGIRRPVNNILEAINFLGLEVVRSMVFSVKLFSQFEDTKVTGFSLEELCRRGINTGLLARQIIKEEVDDSELQNSALIAGTLHDLGKLLLSINFPEKYDNVVRESRQHQIPEWQIEKDVFGGVTHAEIGAYLLGVWGIKEDIVEALAFHHYPSRCSNLQFSALTAIHIADHLMYEHEGESWNGLVGIDENYLEDIGGCSGMEAWKNMCKQVF